MNDQGGIRRLMFWILAKAGGLLELVYGERAGHAIAAAGFFAGIALVSLVDRLIPSFGNPHEIRNIDPRNIDPGAIAADRQRKLLRMGTFSAVAIAVHNFPEGLATFLSALADPALGISIAAAIAIHNIPEGIVVSVPVYYATKNRRKAFCLSLLSGLAEPVGALLGWLLLRRVYSDAAFGLLSAGVAGIMVYISLDELLPTAEEYGEHHIAIGGLVGGMAVMAASLILFL